MKIVLVTGGFDPLHSGHIEYFKAAKQLGNLLVKHLCLLVNVKQLSRTYIKYIE